MSVTLDEVVRELLAHGSRDPIPADRVRSWMRSTDVETQGATFKLLHHPEHYSRIKPPLAFEDYRGFHLEYYERCMKEDPQGVWADSRYLAAHSLVGWFRGLWRDSAVPRAALHELRTLLENLYLAEDEKVRVCVVTGALEHLFEDRQITRFFSSWSSHPILGRAFREACGYAQGRDS